jgi:hypothetical protein
MLTFKDLIHRLIPNNAKNANFVLRQNQLFSKRRMNVKHDRIQFLRKRFKGSPDIKMIDLQGEEFYLLLIHVDKIVHFFHDVFFPFYHEWRKNKKRVCISIRGDKFQQEFIPPY